MFVSAAIARESNPDPINHFMRGNFPVNYEKKPNAIVSASKTVVPVGKNSFKLWNFTGTLSGFKECTCASNEGGIGDGRLWRNCA